MTKEHCLELSDLMTKMATHAICHTIVDHEELMEDERIAVANAFLQRVTSTHLCNHKLTKEGIVLEYRGEAFSLHESYKTMMLTRSVYEHLAMFYFLYTYPKTDEERRVVWDVWKINSKKNLDDNDEEIETLRKDILFTRLGMECHEKLDEWTAAGKPAMNACIEFFRNRGTQDVRRVSYNQAWRYLFGKEQEDMDQLYRVLSIHSHPVYGGLMQYRAQPQDDDSDADAAPLYLSCCFLASLTRLYLRLFPGGHRMFDTDFSEHERQEFKALCRIATDA